MAETGAGRASCTSARDPTRLETVVEVGPRRTPCCAAWSSWRATSAPRRSWVELTGTQEGKAWGAWPFRTPQRHGVHRRRGHRSGHGLGDVGAHHGRGPARRVGRRGSRAGRSPRSRCCPTRHPRWLDRRTSSPCGSSWRVERNRRDGLRFAVHQLSFPGAQQAVDAMCERLPAPAARHRLHDPSRPQTIVLLLTAGCRPRAFTHLRRRLLALWDERWARRGSRRPGPQSPTSTSRSSSRRRPGVPDHRAGLVRDPLTEHAPRALRAAPDAPPATASRAGPPRPAIPDPPVRGRVMLPAPCPPDWSARSGGSRPRPPRASPRARSSSGRSPRSRRLLENALDAGRAHDRDPGRDARSTSASGRRRRRRHRSPPSSSWRSSATPPARSTALEDLDRLALARLPRRGAAEHRRGEPAAHLEPRRRGGERAAFVAVEGGAVVERGAARARRGHHGRGRGPVLQHARAAQVPALAGGRAARRDPHARVLRARATRRSRSGSSWTSASARLAAVAGRAAVLREPRTRARARRIWGAAPRRAAARGARRARRHAAVRAARPAGARARHARGPGVPRQPALDPEPAARRRRCARRTATCCPRGRFPAGAAVAHRAARPARRERAPDQARGALRRRGRGVLAGRRRVRAAARARCTRRSPWCAAGRVRAALGRPRARAARRDRDAIARRSDSGAPPPAARAGTAPRRSAAIADRARPRRRAGRASPSCGSSIARTSWRRCAAGW